MNKLPLFILFLFFAQSYLYSQVVRGIKIVDTETNNVISPDSTYAIVVGVSKYEYIQSLKYADADAEEFYKYLVSDSGAGLPVSHVVLALNREVTRSSLLNNFYSFIGKNIDRTKRVVIYFAGHGDADDFGEHYLLASGCNPAGDANNYAATDALSFNELKSKLRYFLGSGIEVLIIIDACRTERLFGKSMVNAFDISSQLEQTKGEMIFLSCEKGQVSQEGRQWGNGRGLFSYYLTNGLMGAADKNMDRKVTIEELKRYTESSIYNDSLNKTSQIPVFQYLNNSNYPIFFCSSYINNPISRYSNDIKDALSYRNTQNINTTAFKSISELNFYQSIREKKLTYPPDNCCTYFLQQMKGEKLAKQLLDNASNALAIEMLDSCIRIMNLYVSGADHLGDYKYKYGNIFTHGKILFSKAEELLAEIAPDIIQVNKHIGLFLKGRSVLEIEDKATRIAMLPEALSAANDALQIKPKCAFLHHLKALLLNEMDKKEDAIRSENESIRLAPMWMCPYNTLGGILFSQRKYLEAITQYHKAVNCDTNSFIPYNGLGNAYKRIGDLQQALFFYNKSIAKDTLSAVSYYNRAFYFFQLNQAEKAKLDYEKSISINANLYQSYIGLAMFYERKRQYDKAVIQYKKAVAIDSIALIEMFKNIDVLKMAGETENYNYMMSEYSILEKKYKKK